MGNEPIAKQNFSGILIEIDAQPNVQDSFLSNHS